MRDRRRRHHVGRARADRGGAGHHAPAARRLGEGDRRVRHRLLVVRAIGRQRRRARPCSASPMPATLPWPKIAQTPAKSGTVSPSISVFWAASSATSACAMVRRIVLPSSSHPCPASLLRAAAPFALSAVYHVSGLPAPRPRRRRAARTAPPSRRPPPRRRSRPRARPRAASAKIVRPTAKPLTLGAAARRCAKASASSASGASRPEQHDAAAERIARLDGARRRRAQAASRSAAARASTSRA